MPVLPFSVRLCPQVEPRLDLVVLTGVVQSLARKIPDLFPEYWVAESACACSYYGEQVQHLYIYYVTT